MAQGAAIDRAAASDLSGHSRDAALLTLLERDLARLPADERELLEEKYFSRRSVRELATEHRTTEKAIESRLVRIRRKLKASLLHGLKEEPDLQQGSDPVCAFSEPRVHGRGFFCRKKRADGPLGESGPP